MIRNPLLLDYSQYADMAIAAYDLGFLGICAEGAQPGVVSKGDYDFYFFNQKIAPNLEQSEVLKALKFAIHPVFIEYLARQMNAPFPVMMLTLNKYGID